MSSDTSAAADSSQDVRSDVRKGRKYDQVIDGAQKVFLRDGFEGASVDDIARQAGVSKATLYSYFPDKKLLFLEVASMQCYRQADEALLTIDQSQPPEIVLRQVATRFHDFMLSELGQKIFRVCVGESDRFPELGRRFYQSGPMLLREKLGGYLKTACARGELQVDDFDLAADQFAEMCKADLWVKMIFGMQSTFTQAERDRVVDGAIATFMARYGA
jgi:AcrR family transcriptional regulator